MFWIAFKFIERKYECDTFKFRRGLKINIATKAKKGFQKTPLAGMTTYWQAWSPGKPLAGKWPLPLQKDDASVGNICTVPRVSLNCPCNVPPVFRIPCNGRAVFPAACARSPDMQWQTLAGMKCRLVTRTFIMHKACITWDTCSPWSIMYLSVRSDCWKFGKL